MVNGKVTIQDVYDIVNRLEDKVDRKLEIYDSNIKELDKNVDDINSRLSNIEGRASFFSIAISTMVSALISWFKK
jgi:hypothetical protein